MIAQMVLDGVYKPLVNEREFAGNRPELSVKENTVMTL